MTEQEATSRRLAAHAQMFFDRIQLEAARQDLTDKFAQGGDLNNPDNVRAALRRVTVDDKGSYRSLSDREIEQFINYLVMEKWGGWSHKVVNTDLLNEPFRSAHEADYAPPTTRSPHWKTVAQTAAVSALAAATARKRVLGAVVVIVLMVAIAILLYLNFGMNGAALALLGLLLLVAFFTRSILMAVAVVVLGAVWFGVLSLRSPSQPESVQFVQTANQPTPEVTRDEVDVVLSEIRYLRLDMANMKQEFLKALDNSNEKLKAEIAIQRKNEQKPASPAPVQKATTSSQRRVTEKDLLNLPLRIQDNSKVVMAKPPMEKRIK